MTGAMEQYAIALYDLAQEAGTTPSVLKDVAMVNGLFLQNPAYVKITSAPALPKEERVGLVFAAFAGKIDRQLLNVLRIFAEKRWLHGFAAFEAAFTQKYNQENGVLPVCATTAVPMAAAQQQALKKRLEEITGKALEMQYKVDPAILGGVALKMETASIDGSVERKLEILKKRLEDSVI